MSMATWQTGAKAVTPVTNQAKGSASLTWDQATFTWDQATGTWDDPYSYVNQTKNASAFVNDPKD